MRRLGSDLQRIANRRLLMIDAAETLNDLRVPPGNHLEQLQGARAGQHSIRVNDQWRIASSGPEPDPLMLKSLITTEGDDHHGRRPPADPSGRGFA